jgi:AcrR family transcriptional regulator
MITPSTSNSKSYHHGDLRVALVGAALEMLGEGDVEKLSLRAVARRAGVSAMAPYRHYPDKEALLAAVAQTGFDGLRAVLQAADSAASANQALLAQGVAYVRYAMDNRILFRLMFGPPRRGKHPDLTTSSETAFSVLVQRIGQQFGSAELQPRILGFWSLVHGLAMLVLDDQTAVAGLASPNTEEISAVIASMLRLGAPTTAAARDRP